MDVVQQTAYETVGRACGFAGFAILCVMVGFSFDPLLAAKTGGVLMLTMTLVLGYRAKCAPARPYKDTETWLLIKDTDHCPPAATAQQVIGTALREAYVWFGRYSALITVVLWITVIVLAVVKVVFV